eukprot:TRINITY_DN6821_c0_g1_i3.p1 TRINITY_DN6821_c0_g1~~TRINITY_DN6821_c0_g1_i3.p1  ORF type:complete len:164 (-),score=31.16 TRINITY_DN6821_c0_g1_i3:249-740(-)
MLISPSALLSVWISAFALEIWSKTRERISHGGLKESLEEESLKSECAVLMRRMMDLNAADAYEHYIQAQREYIEKTKALNEIREQREQCQQSLVDLRKILHKSFEILVSCGVVYYYWSAVVVHVPLHVFVPFASAQPLQLGSLVWFVVCRRMARLSLDYCIAL